MGTWGLYLAPHLVTHSWKCVLVVLHPRGEARVSFRLVKFCNLQCVHLESRQRVVEGQLAYAAGMLRLPHVGYTLAANESSTRSPNHRYLWTFVCICVYFSVVKWKHIQTNLSHHFYQYLNLDWTSWSGQLFVWYSLQDRQEAHHTFNGGQVEKNNNISRKSEIMDLTLLLTSVTVSPLELEQRALCEGI